VANRGSYRRKRSLLILRVVLHLKFRASAIPNGFKEVLACEFLLKGTCFASSLEMAIVTNLYGLFQSLGMS
jgi:hypothetical protein